MKIDEELSKCKSAETVICSAGEAIFSFGDKPLFYYIISKGAAKLVDMNGEAKEIIQEESGIAEFTIFIDEPYPCTAIAVTDCEIIRINKSELLALAKENPEVNMYFHRKLSESVQREFSMDNLEFIANQSDNVKVLLNFLKRRHTDATPYSFPISLTRQEIAGLTGLSIETVSTTMQQMQNKNMLRIIDQTIFY